MSYQDIIYMHSKGHLYRIIHFGLDEATLEPEVAYRQCNTEGEFVPGQIFHRSCEKFFDGRFVVYEEPDGPEEVTNIFAPAPAPPEPTVAFTSKRDGWEAPHMQALESQEAEFPLREVLTATERQMEGPDYP